MAGRPRTRALLSELEDRAREHDLAGIFEYAEYWIESGGTIESLAKSVADTTDLPVMRATLTRHLYKIAEEAGLTEAECERRLMRARSIGALAMADQTLEIADSATADDVQQARLKVQARQWVAERYNRDQLGQKTGVSVSVTVGSLHLDALRAAPIRMGEIVTGSPQNVLTSGSEGMRNESSNAISVDVA